MKKRNRLMKRILAGGLALVIAGGCMFGGWFPEKEVLAAEAPALTVDFTQETGEIIHGAAGFLYGVSSEEVPTTNTMVPLKPKVLCTKGALGTEHPYGDALDVAKTFLESGGEQVMMYNSNYYGVFGVTANYKDYAKVLEETIVPKVVEWKNQWKEGHKSDNLSSVDIDKALIYIPINEGTPKVGADYNTVWEAYYRAIKKADPHAVIAGPNSAKYNTQFDNEFAKDITMRSYTQYCITHDCLPDIVTWHDLEVDKLDAMKREMADFREGWEKADWSEYFKKHPELNNVRPDIPQICINEYADFADCGVPGRLVNWIARLEDEKIYGCLPFWHQANNLNDLTADANEGNGAWWLYKWYGDMSGQTVKVTSNTSYEKLYGVASIDATKKIATTLFGGVDGMANVNLLNVNKTEAFKGAEKVHVKLESTAYSGYHGARDQVPVIMEGTFPVNTDGSVTVPMNNMKFSTAYNLTITEAGEKDEVTDPLVNNYQKVYEAEQGDLSADCEIKQEGDFNPRYYLSDGRLVDMPRGAQLTYTIYVPSDGKYRLDFIYGNETGSSRNDMGRHNPQNVMQKFTIDKGEGRDVMMESTLLTAMTGIKTLYADFSAGEHTIQIQTTGEGRVGHDSLTVTWSGAKHQEVLGLNNRYEAEQADFNKLLGKKDTTVKTETAIGGYSSNGYVTGLSKRSVPEGGGIRWNVVVKESGLYNVSLRYQTKAAGVFRLYQGNTATVLDRGVKEIAAGKSDTWQESTITLYFQKGINIIDVDASMECALDYMQVQAVSAEETAARSAVIEAEDCVKADSGIEVRESFGASNGKYVVGMKGAQDAENQQDKCLSFTYDAPSAGTYQMRLFQSNNDICGTHWYNTKIIDKYATVKVNDTARRYFFINTFSDDTFREKTITVELKEGANEIKIFNDDSWHVLWGGTTSTPGTNELVNYAPNFDKFIFTPLTLEQAIEIPAEYGIQLQATNGGSVTVDKNTVQAGGEFNVTMTPDRDINRVLVNGKDRTKALTALENGSSQLKISGVQENQLVQVYFEEGNIEYRDAYIKNAGFGSGTAKDWTADKVTVEKTVEHSYEGYYALMEKGGSISQKVRLDAGYYKLEVLGKGEGSASLSIEELKNAKADMSLVGNGYQKTELTFSLKNYREITIKADASGLTSKNMYLDNFMLTKLEGRGEEQISTEYEYFVDCGDHNTDTLSDGVQYGKRNYVTDQLYGKDLRTGYLWGVVTSDKDTAINAPAGSGAAYTAFQWAYEGNTLDNQPMNATFRYAHEQDKHKINPRYVKYRFQLEPGNYEVTVGMGNMWGNSANPDVYAGEGNKDTDTKLNTDKLNIAKGANAEVSGTVTLTEGQDSLYVYALSSELTINMNYIQIRKLAEVMDQKLKSITVMAPDKTLYDLGEGLDTAGMTVTAVYEDESREPVNLRDCTIGTLESQSEGQKEIEVSYTKGDVTAKASFTVLVKKMTDTELLYFTDCGDHNPDKPSDGDQLGKYNSVTDQIYGVDSKEGKSWGVVTSEKDVVIEAQGGSKGVFTTYQRANTNPGCVADDQPKTTSFRYAHGQDGIGTGIATRYVKYGYELEPGTYHVTVGMGNAWNNSANPNVYAGSTGDSLQDTKLHDAPLRIGNLQNTEVSKEVVIPEGGNKMYVYALSDDPTINMNYILIQRTASVATTIPASLEVTPPTKKEYGLGDELDYTGMKVMAVYGENGAEVKRNIGISQCVVSGFDSETAGNKTVTVAFTENGKTVSATFQITVKQSMRITANDGIVAYREDLSKYTNEQSMKLFNVHIENGDGYTAEFDYSDVDTEVSGSYDVVVKAMKDGKAVKETTVKLTVKADTAELSERFKEAKALKEEDYTADSYARLKAVLDEAQKILDSKDYIPQSEVDKKTELLQKAVGRLQKSVKAIEITANPDKLVYQIGEPLSIVGLKLKVIYSDNTEGEVTQEYVEVSGYDSAKAGKQMVTVLYEGKTATFDVTVEEPEEPAPPTPQKRLEAIRIKQNPTKTVYVEGEELDLTGLVVEAVYNDKSTEEILGYTYAGYDKAQIGNQTITITYEGKTAEFPVRVTQKPALNKSVLEAKIAEARRFSAEGYTSESFAQLQSAIQNAENVLQTCGTQEEIDSAVNTLRAAMNALVTVEPDAQISSVEISRYPDKLEFIQGEIFTREGLMITAYYTDGTSVEISGEDVDVIGYDMSLAGEQEVTVIYKGHKAIYKITVKEKPQELVKDNVTVSVPEGSDVDLGNVRLEVQPAASTEERVIQMFGDIKDKLHMQVSGENAAVLDIKLIDANSNQEIQPKGMVLVTILKPENYSTNLKLFHLHENTLQETAFELVEGKKLVFSVDSFSLFTIVDMEKGTEEPPVQPDKTALDTKLREAGALKQEDYTAESWKLFQDTLADAKAVYENKNASQEQVNAAVAALEGAMNALVPAVTPEKADKSALKTLLDTAKALKKNDYTDKSWEQFQKALDDAEAVYADEGAAQEKVNDAEAALKTAMESLIKNDPDQKEPSSPKPGYPNRPESSAGANTNGGSSNSAQSGKTAPRTGDEAHLAMLMCILISALSVIAVVMNCKSRKSKAMK